MSHGPMVVAEVPTWFKIAQLDRKSTLLRDSDGKPVTYEELEKATGNRYAERATEENFLSQREQVKASVQRLKQEVAAAEILTSSSSFAMTRVRSTITTISTASPSLAAPSWKPSPERARPRGASQPLSKKIYRLDQRAPRRPREPAPPLAATATHPAHDQRAARETRTRRDGNQPRAQKAQRPRHAFALSKIPADRDSQNNGKHAVGSGHILSPPNHDGSTLLGYSDHASAR